MTPRRLLLRLAGDAARCLGARAPAAASAARAAAVRGAGAVARSDVRDVGCRPNFPAWTRGFAAAGSEPLTEDALKKRMDEINEFVRFHNLPPSLQGKIRSYVEFAFSVTKVARLELS